MKQITDADSMHETGCSGLVHWYNPAGWDGEGGGGEIWMGNTCVPMAGSVQFSSVAQLCPALCDPMNRSTSGLPVHHQIPEFTQTPICEIDCQFRFDA